MPPRARVYTKSSAFEEDFYLVENENISNTNRYILKAYQKLAPFEGMKKIEEELVEQEIKVSMTTIKVFFKKLSEAGVLEEVKYREEGSVKLQISYNIGSIRPYITELTEKKSKRRVGGRTKGRDIDRAINAIENATSKNYLDLKENTQDSIDQLFCIVDAAMKSSGKDKSRKKEIKYYFAKDDYIQITAVTTTDDNDDIAYLSDQRVIRLLNGAYRDRMKEHEDSIETMPTGEFGFDLHDLMKKMALANSGNNKDLVRDMIRRLKATVFKVDARNSRHFLNVFGVDVMELSYITEFSALTEKEIVDSSDELNNNNALKHDQKLTERFYKVKLHSEIVKSMGKEGGAFISHPALAREKVGLAHRINNWCKAVVGVRASQDKKNLIYTIDQFHEKVHPASTRQNFSRDFHNLITRQSSCTMETKGETLIIRSTLYGYIFEVIDNEDAFRELTRKAGRRMPNRKKDFWLIRVSRDANDKFVGDNSRHNRALRNEQSQLGLLFDY